MLCCIYTTGVTKTRNMRKNCGKDREKYVTDNRGVRYCQEPYLAEWLEESGQVDTEED